MMEMTDEFSSIFDDVTDGLEDASVDDIARAVAATCSRCGIDMAAVVNAWQNYTALT